MLLNLILFVTVSMALVLYTFLCALIFYLGEQRCILFVNQLLSPKFD